MWGEKSENYFSPEDSNVALTLELPCLIVSLGAVQWPFLKCCPMFNRLSGGCTVAISEMPSSKAVCSVTAGMVKTATAIEEPGFYFT